MRNWVLGGCTLLCAGAAHGAALSQPYATVGNWEVSADDRHRCAMMQLFESTVADETQVLGVVYDVQKGVVLSWASKKPKFLPPKGSLELDLAFLTGESSNETWGSQSFEYKKVAGTYYFNHVFADRNNVDRLLADLSSSEIVSLSLGPTLMMALPLAAADAVQKLRECAAKGNRAF